MDPAAKLFRYDEALASVGLGEPSITLIENDVAFGVLLAESAHQDSYSDKLYLDQVTLLRIKGKGWAYRDFQQVAIHPGPEGIWIAQDVMTGDLLREPSVVPYHVIFISAEDFEDLGRRREENLCRPVFDYAQMLFGKLPGFSYEEDVLVTPDEYATAGKLLRDASFVVAK